MRRGRIAAAAAAAAAILAAAAGMDASLRNAERAVLFSTAARPAPGGGAWLVPVRGMLYEPEARSPSRRLALSALRKGLGIGEVPGETAIFRRRAAAFLVDRQSGEGVDVRFPASGFRFPPGETGRDGRFAMDLRLPAPRVLPLLRDRGGTPGWVEVRVSSEDGRRALGRGWIQCVPAEGVTVVSDIDDTVKETGVLDRREMIAGTFLREFRPVPGMAEAYRRWAAEGACFHYLSAGPLPLQGFLEEFLADARFPAGPLSMREFLWNRDALGDLLAGDPAAFKGGALDGLAADFPGRRFVLVGDSGERDPEAYGAFARRHPGAVAAIRIREVRPGGSPQERYAEAFAGLDPALWRVFTDPAELGPLPR